MTWWIDAIIIAAGVPLAASVLFGAWWLWWRLPKREVDRLRSTIRDPKARADVEDNFRKSVGQILIGIGAALIGSAFTYLQFVQQQRQSSLQAQVARETLLSNEVANGYERLGSDKMLVRIGGIYTLAGVINTSERYYQPLLEALSAFVRDVTRTATDNGPPATDIQAALTVIGSHAAIGTALLDLRDVHIPGADLRNSNLHNANLSHADLHVTLLSGADLSGAILSDARLGGADLSYADLNSAALSYADLSYADLREADLNSATLSYADLSDANLRGANLTLADLRGATITQGQLDQACGTDAGLDYGLALKPCPD